MSYYDRLTPWCITRCLPGCQTVMIQRFRKRSEAEAHLKILRQLTPDAVYELVFDLPEPRSDSPADEPITRLPQTPSPIQPRHWPRDF
ncbi:MAG: hypothetical protein EDM05_037200 [Leptolyngbya sp. IPPAS B-1204]|nr:hypothetical protein [Elainella sp. C42_A2020_010]RNJ68956.1 MAG: hypothetical protein EDM05_12070 [Leptolyngbya sp. IPPAS B-1204]